MIKNWSSRGDGKFNISQFAKIGDNVIFEDGTRVFHPESIELGNNVYVGHNTILQGYYKNRMIIGDNTFIGPNCFFHSAGNIVIGKNVGIAAYSKILTSVHREESLEKPLSFSEIVYAEVVVEDNVHIGIGTVVLPGVRIGEGAQIGAGAVVSRDIPKYAVAVGVPAKVIRIRT